MAQRDFSTQFVRFGSGGLNLRPQTDVVPTHQLSRMTNVVRRRTGSLTARLGQTALATAAGKTAIHSFGRLNIAQTNDFQRIWGADTELYYGKTGALTSAESGFSGNPLTMIGADPPIPGDPWMYVADSLKMRKIRADGLDLEIGLRAGVLISTVLGSTALENAIEAFTATAAWVGQPDPFDPSAGVPTFGLVTDPLGAPNNALEITTDPGTSPGPGYENLADKPIGPLDLSQYPAVTPAVPATDNDLMHLWLQPSANVVAVMVYLTSGTFTPGAVPGTDPVNNRAAVRCILNISPAMYAIWNEFGPAPLVLRRSDFNQSGFTFSDAMDWANVTGLSFRILTSDLNPATVDFWNFKEVATAPSGTATPPYDWRVTNYDPRTGVEGNPSPIQPQANWLDSLGTFVVITPEAYGDAAIRQRGYRRGNTLPDDWHFVGENTSDGGPIYDSNSDGAIEAAPVVQINHDQPVTSIDADGNALLAQPCPILFGPVNGLFYLLGDPRRPNGVYQSLPDAPDYWPANYFFPITAAGEPLLTGCIWGGEGYVASNQRWFRLLPNLTDAGILTSQPTGATKGPIARWAMVVGPVGVEFVSNDGWYIHTGGPQENLSDAEMYPLFNPAEFPDGANGYLPIDFTDPTTLRMGTWLNEVWLNYIDTHGDRHCLVRNTQTKEWRIVDFWHPITAVFGEIEDDSQPPKELILCGAAHGGGATAYTHSGTADGGTAISCVARTGALDQGAPRNPKQYGDIVLSYVANAVNIDVQARLDDESVVLAADTLPVGSRISQVNPFGPTPTEGRNISVDVSWSASTAPPVINFVGVSYFLEPDVTQTRLTDWDDGGSPAEKLVKGIVLDCDTQGQTKTLIIEGTLYDSAVFTIATIQVNANGRRRLAFSWPMLPASLIRVRPDDANPWIKWGSQWIFDEQPLRLGRWETDQLTFGFEWSSILWAFICYQSAQPVTLTHKQWNEAGVLTTKTYLLPATAGGLRQRTRQTFEAGKGVLHQLVFTADERFLLFREETHFVVKPWQGEATIKHPVGNDDLSLVRGMQSSEGTAVTPGGGENQ